MFFLEHGFSNPFREFDLLRLTLQGLKRQQGQQPRRLRQPVTPRVLTRLQRALRQDRILSSQDKKMVWAAFTTAFYGFLRASEFTTQGRFNPRHHLAASDVHIGRSGVTLRLKASKTDQYRKGHTVRIRTLQGPLCPVVAMSQYRQVMGVANRAVPFFQF